uniref:A-kinase anchoring protein 13 n=1 Tax=Cyclopterus lumpus TaxID=8103 RepID=A0A8C3AKJ8_CYCLU
MLSPVQEKDREKKEKDKEGKEKDKKAINGHLFTPVSSGPAAQCFQCNKAFNSKEAFQCTRKHFLTFVAARIVHSVMSTIFISCNVSVSGPAGGTRERPWSAILSPEDHSSLMLPSRRHTSMMAFHGNNLSKSLSISNILQVVSTSCVLFGAGTEMMDGQLMGEFEAEAKELEADSWSLCAEQQYLQQLDKDLAKRQDVIYELMQTEMHHIRTLRIMSEVFSKGLQKEVQLELQTVEKLFPALDELLELHSQHLLRLLERKRESQLEGGSSEGGFIINRIGDILVVISLYCSPANEFYVSVDCLEPPVAWACFTEALVVRSLFQKKMSSSIVRRLGIPECILLVTQRITKYPVLIQRMLQHTKGYEDDHEDLTEAVRLVKEVIAAVDSKVNEHDKRRRLKDFHGRMDSKSIMMTKSGQIFAREDLLRRRLIHDGVLQLKNCQGRLKDVHALLLSDVFVFLQEKDQKYVFAMLDQRCTVISLQKLIVREVANEERGLFLITAGIEKPEMMEVLASSKDERNTWMQLIQEAMQSM